MGGICLLVPSAHAHLLLNAHIIPDACLNTRFQMGFFAIVVAHMDFVANGGDDCITAVSICILLINFKLKHVSLFFLD